MKITTNSEKETFDFAKKYANKLKGGDVIGLIGDLGAGKTVFTKGLASGLGIIKHITSPTFVLMKVYKIQNSKPARAQNCIADGSKIQNLIHIDAYRINNENDIIGIGIEEYLNKKDTIVVIEWAEKIKKILTKNTKYVTMKYKSNNSRFINIKI